MQDLEDQLSMMLSSCKGNQNFENLETLRQILDNLISISFSQEELILKTKETNKNSSEFIQIIRTQKKIKDDSEIVKDSLLALSKRVIEIQNEWKKVGYIPKKISSSLWNEFRPLCNDFFNKLKSKSKISNEERTTIKKDKEKQTLKRKISELQNESNQFENNLEYFTNSSSDNPLFKDVSSKITSINDEIEVLKKKLSKIIKTEKAEGDKVATTEAETSNEVENLNDGES